MLLKANVGSAMAFVRSLLSLSSLIALSAFSGCSDSQDSDVKTLDAFSSNLTQSELRCSAKGIDKTNIELHSYWRFKDKVLPETALDETRKAALIKQAVVALTAVPEPIVELFFATGDLRITTDASRICSGKTAKDESKGYAGCVVALTFEGKTTHAIIADASDYGVSGTIVRSFGYWVSQNLSGLYAAGSKTYSLNDNSKVFMENQRQITDLYFHEVVKGKKFDISHFDSFLGKNGTATIGHNVLKTKNEALAGITFNTKDDEIELRLKRRQFESFVFAESFDSYHCNDHAANASNTNKLFLHLFPTTYGKFGSVISAVRKEVQAYLEKNKSGNALSFNLQDTTTTPAALDKPATTVTAEPIVTGNAQPSAVPATTAKPPVVQPDAVTVIIDAQGQIIDESQIQVIKPDNGLDQDLNIEIINQGTPGTNQNTGVEIGGLQPIVPSLDSNIVSPIAPVTPIQPVQPVQPVQPLQPAVTQPSTTQQPGNQQPITNQHPGQHPQPMFPMDMGQQQQIHYPHINNWPAHGGGGGGGGFVGCGG